jgi:hypothetical protein
MGGEAGAGGGCDAPRVPSRLHFLPIKKKTKIAEKKRGNKRSFPSLRKRKKPQRENPEQRPLLGAAEKLRCGDAGAAQEAFSRCVMEENRSQTNSLPAESFRFS